MCVTAAAAYWALPDYAIGATMTTYGVTMSALGIKEGLAPSFAPPFRARVVNAFGAGAMLWLFYGLWAWLR